MPSPARKSSGHTRLRIFVNGETVSDSPRLEALLAFAHHPEVELIGTDSRFSNRLYVGAYDSQNAYSPWEIKFEDGRRLSSAVVGPDIQRIGRDLVGSWSGGARRAGDGDAERRM